MNKTEKSEISQINRIHRLILLLKEAKYSVMDLAKKLGVGRQTIYRDIQVLGDEGYLIDTKNKKYFIFEASTKSTFTEEETQLILETLAIVSETNPLKASILKKLSPSSNILPLSNELKDKHLGVIIQDLQIAIKNNFQVKLIGYQSLNSEEIKDRLVIPLRFTENYDTLFALDNGKEKSFKIKRIADVEIIEEIQTSTSAASEVDIFGFSSGKPIPVHLLLNKRASQLFYEEYSSARVHLTKLDSHSTFTHELKLDIHNYAGIGRWCLGLMGQLKVLGDEGLKNYLNDKIKISGEF
jgi:proteasome accessory factor C